MILVELTAAINEAGTPKTFYLSTEGFVSGGGDTPADVVFEPRLRDAGVGLEADAHICDRPDDRPPSCLRRLK